MNAAADPPPMSAAEARAAAFGYMARDMRELDDAPESEPIARPWRPLPSRGDIVPAWGDLAPVRADVALLLGRLEVAVDRGLPPRGPMPAPRYHGRPGATLPALAPVDDYLPERGEAVAWDVDDSG